ncbi:MAG: hypothetical protein LAN71_16530, partial [Acidobacteriia bacterium]|nr:hypothetical protein [Terriglobia bacterium]
MNTAPPVTVTIDPELKKKCPRVALACVTAQLTAGDSPAALLDELRALEEKIAALPEPRAVLEAAPIVATRVGYKALGKDPARYRGSAEALLRRVIAGKGLPRIHAVVDIINLVSVESRYSIGLYDLARVEGSVVATKKDASMAGRKLLLLRPQLRVLSLEFFVLHLEPLIGLLQRLLCALALVQRCLKIFEKAGIADGQRDGRG